MDRKRADWKREGDEYVSTIRKRDDEIKRLNATIYSNQQKFDDEKRKLQANIDALECEVTQLKEQLKILAEIKG
jgi:hypothetical protein